MDARATDLWVSRYLRLEGLREAVECCVLHTLPLVCDRGRKSRSVDGGKGTRLLVLLGLLVPSQRTVPEIYVFDRVNV